MRHPVLTLRQRRAFLIAVAEVAKDCNWSERDFQSLQECLWDDLVAIDNEVCDVFLDTYDVQLAMSTWREKSEEMINWLSRIFGIPFEDIEEEE